MNKLYSRLIANRLWDLTGAVRSGQLYVLLDAARDERIFPALRDSDLDLCCMLTGNITETLTAAAPFLVRLEPDAPLMEILTRDGWGDAWGTYCISTADLKNLLTHFRSCLRVQTEEDEELFFRFYDPRVLRTYLPTCREEELATFFGPVESFIIETEEPKTFLQCAREGAGFKSEQLPFSEIV